MQAREVPLYQDTDGQAIEVCGLIPDCMQSEQIEALIRQQNDFLSSVIESLTHPFYVVRVDDYWIEIANSAARQEGIPESSVCYTLTHGRDRPCGDTDHVCPIAEIVRTKRPAITEHVHRAPNGGIRNVEMRGYPLFDQEGNVSRAIMYALDVTQRKRAEQALRESEARWRSVTENSPDYVIILDPRLEIQYVNRVSPGLTVEALIGTPLWTLVSEEWQLEIKQILEGVLETGQPQSYETRYDAPDGSVVYYESRVVVRQLDGQKIGLMVNARDITEHKGIEQALREAKEIAEQARRIEQERRHEVDRRRRIAESLAGVLVALNSNQPLQQVLDRIVAQANELLGTQAVVLYHVRGQADDLHLQAAAGAFSDTLRSDGRPIGMKALLQAVQSRQTVFVSDLEATPAQPLDARVAAPVAAQLAIPIIVQDQVYGGILLYYGSARMFSEEDLELAAVFAEQAALAVENTQLREHVRETAVAAERSRLARDLHDSVTQALFSASLVAEVLPQVWQRNPQEAWQGIQELRALSRSALAEMRTLLLELRPTALVETNLHDLLVQLVEAVTGRTQVAVQLEIEPGPSLPPMVHVAFYRVAQEALNNVVKHSGADRVSVSLRMSPPFSQQRVRDWRGQVTLSVIDNGNGFDQALVGPDHLGLGFMRERAAEMGGRLTVQSQPGQGTRVFFAWDNLCS